MSSPESPISWEVAERVALRVAERQPWVSKGRLAVLEEDFAELTAQAEELVAAETGLTSGAGPARARVVDRPGWVLANVASMQRLLRPLADKLQAASAKPVPMVGPVPVRVPPQVLRKVGGAQLGALLGWMSTRVLGQYDQLLVEDEAPEDQDLVYYVGPNILAIEDRHGFEPRQFRLWVALHEVTHRAQFTGAPWLRDHFVGLVGALIEGTDPDPRRLLDAVKRALAQVREGQNPLDDGGLAALLASGEQRQALASLGGLMSLLEGHGDIVMNRLALDLAPGSPRFAEVLQERRTRKGAAKLVSSLVGLDAKLRQYQEGEHFVEAVQELAGRDLFDRIWQGPEWLPTLDEIRDPALWVARATGLGRTA